MPPRFYAPRSVGRARKRERAARAGRSAADVVAAIARLTLSLAHPGDPDIGQGAVLRLELPLLADSQRLLEVGVGAFFGLPLATLRLSAGDGYFPLVVELVIAVLPPSLRRTARRTAGQAHPWSSGKRGKFLLYVGHHRPSPKLQGQRPGAAIGDRVALPEPRHSEPRAFRKQKALGREFRRLFRYRGNCEMNAVRAHVVADSPG
jgi:hypothetical protein